MRVKSELKKLKPANFDFPEGAKFDVSESL